MVFQVRRIITRHAKRQTIHVENGFGSARNAPFHGETLSCKKVPCKEESSGICEIRHAIGGLKHSQHWMCACYSNRNLAMECAECSRLTDQYERLEQACSAALQNLGAQRTSASKADYRALKAAYDLARRHAELSRRALSEHQLANHSQNMPFARASGV